jgi:hypothetical protein
MRTRNLGVRPVLRVVQSAFVAATMGIVVAVAGCGGGGGDNNSPAISSAQITTNPAPLTYVGGNASVSVNVTDPAGVTASSVQVDVKDKAGVSLIGGPQVMDPTVSPAGTFTYAFTVPNNIFGTANKVYSVSVTATDTVGNQPLQPVVVGTVTVPFPPAPPPAP